MNPNNKKPMIVFKCRIFYALGVLYHSIKVVITLYFNCLYQKVKCSKNNFKTRIVFVACFAQ